MSVLSVERVIEFPTEAVLHQILRSERLDIVSPFYSGWTLRKLRNSSLAQVRLITRLPDQYHSPPPFLDNDPRPLKDAMERLGTTFSVFALPIVHAKLYVSPSDAWLGSANFTRNGFSGKGELLIRIEPAEQNIRKTFDRFLHASKEVKLRDVSFLVSCLAAGVTRVRPLQDVDGGSGDVPALLAVSYQDFGEWLRSQTGAGYILDRISNKNRMSGHVYSGFHGLCAFFQKNAKLSSRVLRGGQADQVLVLDRLRHFVEEHGTLFGGPRGGTWNSKLSTRLGGTQSGGGAGDVVVKQLLPFIARYMKHKKII
jgi:hypothetical protein